VDLLSQPRWVRYSAHKVPLTVAGGAASSTDPATWSTYAAAKRSTVGVGPGFVLNGDGIVCLDLDHCLVDGQLVGPAVDLLAQLPPTFVEVSPSGDGLHVWGRGHVPYGRRLDGVEVYGTGRYITVTGHRWRGAPAVLADLSDVLAAVL
jgi:primase-polymerase (primpol)-like protein